MIAKGYEGSVFELCDQASCQWVVKKTLVNQDREHTEAWFCERAAKFHMI